MAARHRSRQRALQVLFILDLRDQPVSDAISSFYNTLASDEEPVRETHPDQFMEDLVHGTRENEAEIDTWITKKSEHWRLDRMPVVDRNILRMALYEMTKTDTPPAIVIDEALELARQFSGDESVAFINGVLDAVRRGDGK
ncbi:MAG: transcription antitermination factor NusB [Bryobacterales bacterium]|nr:transcription antitermination factor NusB [Bryobacterales bacterium]MBV9396948.1 transcription antitermination factor NusB [Bryobacterales bacterium]